MYIGSLIVYIFMLICCSAETCNFFLVHSTKND